MKFPRTLGYFVFGFTLSTALHISYTAYLRPFEGQEVLILIGWLNTFVGLLLARGVYDKRPRLLHPAHNRFCHICGADSSKQEPCDSGLHS